MGDDSLQKSVLQALAEVRSPVTGRDIIESGHVQSMEVRDGGDVRFSFALKGDDPGTLVKEARSAVEAVSGVGSVKINVQLPSRDLRRLAVVRAAASNRGRCQLRHLSRAYLPMCPTSLP